MSEHFAESDADPQHHGKGVPAKGARLYIFTPRDRPAGYDCRVVDIVNDPAGQTVIKTFEVLAELSVDHEGSLVKVYPGEVDNPN